MNKKIDAFTSQPSDFITYRKNDILLTKRETEILEKNNIDYKSKISSSLLLYDIDKVLSEENNEELEDVSQNIYERHYYLFTNK